MTYSSEYYQKNKKKLIARAMAYNRANKDKINARRRFNYANNINGVRDKYKKYRNDRAAWFKEFRKEYYHKNKKRLIANMVIYNREWRKKNYDKYLAQARESNKRWRLKKKISRS